MSESVHQFIWLVAINQIVVVRGILKNIFHNRSMKSLNFLPVNVLLAAESLALCDDKFHICFEIA